MYQTIRYEKNDGIAFVTINRPEALNALNSTVISELELVVAEIEKDADLRAMILTGEGRSFVAGADIGEMSTLTKAEGEAFGKLGNATVGIFDTVKGTAMLKRLWAKTACDLCRRDMVIPEEYYK